MTTPIKPARGARHRVQRLPERAAYDRAAVHAVLDAGWIAHVGFVVDGQPFVIPMLYARVDDTILLHGSTASRLQKTLAQGIPVCLSVTHVDGLVLARSHFHHSANYRSVVCFGTAHAVTDPAEKSTLLARFVDAIVPGRAAETRAADKKEFNATQLLRMPIADASAKVRSGPAKDDADDRDPLVWAGVVPMHTAYAAPIASDDVQAGVALPASVRNLLHPRETDA